MKPVKIPRRVDEPPHILMWSADELSPLMLGIFLGVVTGKVLICLILGIVITNIYKKYRDNHPDGYFLHMLYWMGAPVMRSKVFKNPYVRRYLP